MCKPDTRSSTNGAVARKKNGTLSSGAKTRESSPRKLRLLLSLDSYDSRDSADGETPNYGALLITGIAVVAFLFGCEHLGRAIFWHFRYLHPLLEVDANRYILARHLGVDSLSCLIASYLGSLNFDAYFGHVIPNRLAVLLFSFGGSNGSKNNQVRQPNDSDDDEDDDSLALAPAHERRVFMYRPNGFRVATFFFFYQVKNLYDTIVWNDGPEFIFHHVFSMITAWGVLSQNLVQYYTFFFLGVSEVSTAVLCILANFDDVHGVPGLSDAMPYTKIVVGMTFAALFVICRCILWPLCSYYVSKDIFRTLRDLENEDRDDKRSNGKKRIIRGWMYFFFVSLTGLSVLQVAWLGQIVVISHQELSKVGLL